MAELPGGSLDIEFNAHFDTDTGVVTGHGNITGGAGPFANIRASGDYSGHSVGVFEYDVEITGRCHGS